MNDGSGGSHALAEIVSHAFRDRERLPLAARMTTIRTMSRLGGPERELVAGELSDLRLRAAETLEPRDLLSIARLARFGAESGEVSPDDALHWVELAARENPEDRAALTMLADALEGTGNDEAAQGVLRTLASFEGMDNSYALSMRLGILEYNSRDYSAAARSYKRAVQIRPTARAHLYLADALRALDQTTPARTNYLAALRRDRLQVDALRGYWALTKPSDPGIFDSIAGRLMEARPSPIPLNRWLRPVIWRLLRFRYARHPEDARLHIMLGYTAMLRRDFAFARERLTFAYYLPPRRDYRTLVIAALVAAMDADEAGLRTLVADAFAFANEHGRDSLGRQLVTEENASELISPFIWEPRLREAIDPELFDFLFMTLVPGPERQE